MNRYTATIDASYIIRKHLTKEDGVKHYQPIFVDRDSINIELECEKELEAIEEIKKLWETLREQSVQGRLLNLGTELPKQTDQEQK